MSAFLVTHSGRSAMAGRRLVRLAGASALALSVAAGVGATAQAAQPSASITARSAAAKTTKTSAVAKAAGAAKAGKHGKRAGHRKSATTTNTTTTTPKTPRPSETALTGDALASATAAFLAAEPGATVVRAENDADGVAAYEVHGTRADGTRITVYLDASFALVKTVFDGSGSRH